MTGCYTAARFEAGRIRHGLRHARRLRRDARGLGLEAPSEEALLEALVAAGREAFGEGAGVVRLALRAGASPTPLADTRGLGDEPRIWRALRFAEPHPGAAPGAAGAKREGVSHYARARDAAARAGTDEALLWDGAGRLVEGARSNVFLLRADGALVTPPLSSGAVAGVARELVLEGVAEAREVAIGPGDLARARGLVCVNAVRGACRVACVDGEAVGGGESAALAERLHALLLADPPPR